MRPVLFAVLAAFGFTPALAAEDEEPSPYQREPSSLEFRDAWPAAAKPSRATGRVELACTPGEGGTFAACRVGSEKPAGLGFGQAALKLAPKYALKAGTSNNGRLVVQFGDPDYDTEPDWKRRPTREEMGLVYPAEAKRAGTRGKATISCQVTVSGALADCEVVSEDPAGGGWGKAALALAPQFLIHPGTKDGKPVAGGTVRIPIAWAPYTSTVATHRRSTMYSNLAWTGAPSPADVAAAYPAEARAAGAAGDVTLCCRIVEAGRLGGCDTLMEEPKELGFAEAARGLLAHFQGPETSAAGKPTVGGGVDLRFRFEPAALADPARGIGRARWTRTATPGEVPLPQAARQAGLRQGKATLTCQVGAGGALAGCAVAREEPTGLGLGEAALAAVGRFGVNLWSDEGLPVLGAKVNAPVEFGPAEARR